MIDVAYRRHIYTRDQQIALQCDDYTLDESVQARVRQLISCRRGCRAGEHVKRRLLLCRHATGDVVDGHIPTIVGQLLVVYIDHCLESTLAGGRCSTSSHHR